MIQRLALALAGVGLLASAASASTLAVNNNASLKALGAGQAHFVKRLGYVTAGDGGEAEYVWNGASACTDDGGSCIAPNSGAGRWILSNPAPGRPVDIRIFGAVADDSAGDAAANHTAIENAITYAAATHSYALVPEVTVPFQTTGITIDVHHAGLMGPPNDLIGYGGTPNVGCQLHFVDQAIGIEVQTYNVQVKNLSLCGNADVSASATQTVGITWDGGKIDGSFENLFLQDFVIGVDDQGSRSTWKNIWVEDQQLYPNSVNGYPRDCFKMSGGGAGYSTSVQRITNIMCRYQSWYRKVNVSGDGTTAWWDIAQPAGGVPLFRADGIKVRIGTETSGQNGQGIEDPPEDSCGMSSTDGDFTLWDISTSGGAGSGGTQLFCTHTTASVTSGNAQITVPSTTGYLAGSHILVDASHGILPNTTVVSIDDATHLTLSAAPYVTTDKLNIVLTQKDIKTSGAGGTNIEVRFNTGHIPPSGTNNVYVLWIDPTASACIEADNAADYIRVDALMLSGCDTLLKHTGNTDGGIHLTVSYLELANQLAEVIKGFGDDLTFSHVVNPQIPGVTPQSYGGYVAPWWVDLKAGPTTITYNGRIFRYNGAAQGSFGGISNNWYAPSPSEQSPGSIAPDAVDTIECVPRIAYGPWKPNALGVYVTATGTTAKVKLAVYWNDPATNLPGLLASSTPEIVVSGTGPATGALTPLRLESSGMFWLCGMWQWSVAPTVDYVGISEGQNDSGAFVGSPSFFDPIGSSQSVGVKYGTGGLYAAGFPSSLVGLTSALTVGTKIPYIEWRQQ